MIETPNVALVADDDAFFRGALCAILEDRLGFSRIMEATSLDEAWEHLGEQPGITLALFDINMPGMKSPANLATVCELFPGIRIAVVSASRRRDDILTALHAGVHGYLPKGLGIDELTDAIRHVLEGGTYVPPSLADVLFQAKRAPMADDAEMAAPLTIDVLVRLTPRQLDVLRLLGQGLPDEEIMRSLDLSIGAVRIHVAALLRNLGVRNRSAAAAVGARFFRST